MEIRSEPQPETITVTDVDIRFQGETRELTLYDGDTMVESGDGLTLMVSLASRTIGETFATVAEDITVNLHNVLWISRRQRIVTLPPDTADARPHKAK
jgi:hypothetical protein